MSKDMGNIMRRILEYMWHEIPQELKDEAMWDVIAFGAVSPPVEARIFAAIEATFSTRREGKE